MARDDDDAGLLDNNSPCETIARRCRYCGSVDVEPTGGSHAMDYRPFKVGYTCTRCGMFFRQVRPVTTENLSR